MKVVHSWLKEYVGEALPSPEQVEKLLNFHAFEIDGIEDVEGESVIDVDVLPNRASDCLCHRGIARELASILDVTLEYDPLRQLPPIPESDAVAIRIADHEACPRFTISHMSDVTVQESPDWLQKRLRALGQRPINNIVDATNYVMYAIGQPLHVYDADLFPQTDGQWKFNVRFAEPEETVSLLAEGGKDEPRVLTLRGTELLIVDESSDTPVGLAGVKGGTYAGVNAETKNILIEAAHFHPTITRKTARASGIVIDASKRFENEPSRELPLYAQYEIIQLIQKIAGGECEGVVDKYLTQVSPTSVTVTTAKTNSLLGLQLRDEDIIDILSRIGATIETVDTDVLVATSPFERTDLQGEEDYIEEIGRIYGLDKIESVVPEAIPLRDISKRQYYGDKIRQILVSNGFSEVITTSFQKKGHLQLQNALASDKSYLRDSLVKNITKVLDANYSHVDLLGVRDVRVFEIGTVFFQDETGVNEKMVVTLGARTKGNGYHPQDDTILQTGMNAVSAIIGDTVEWESHKGVAELDFSGALENISTPTQYDEIKLGDPVSFTPISPYPAIARDIAMWVPEEILPEAVETSLLQTAGDLCVRISLFDTFNKDGRTSYAFRLVFQSPHRTLTDTEVNTLMDTLYGHAANLGWEVR
jgi:phenylalanyl-tRNA synthetase beta chain